MFRNLADILNLASRAASSVHRRYPDETILFASAATILETPTSLPTGWSLRRILQRRGNVVITDGRIVLRDSLLSLATVIFLSLGAYPVYRGIQVDRTLLIFAFVCAILVFQRRPYSLDVPFDNLNGVKFGSVQGITASGDILILDLGNKTIQVVPAQIVPEAVRNQLSALSRA